jgi:hypothetical protein
MSRPTFNTIVEILEQNTIFQSTGRKLQWPVKYQLACFLFRYSRRGSDSTIPAQELSLGLGTVPLYCRCIMRVLRELGVKLLKWPDNEEQEGIAERIQMSTEDHFPRCIGIGDGTLICLCEAPRKDGPVYYCRKKYPAVSAYSSTIMVSVDL